MLMKRTPELLILAAILAARAISCTPWLFWQQMMAYSILCILIFVTQFIWRVLLPAPRRIAPAHLSLVLATSGQALIVLIIITALHVLFLPSLGIPTFLALSLLGILLLALATLLVLVRVRLAALWTKLE